MDKFVNLLPFSVNFSIIVVLITILVVVVFGVIVLKTITNMVRQRKAEVELKLPSLTEDASKQTHEEVFHNKESVFDKNIYISHGEDVIIDDSSKKIDEDKFIEALSVATGKVIIEEPDMPTLDTPEIEEIEEVIENDSNEDLVTATDENHEEIEEVIVEETISTNEPLIKNFNEADYSDEEIEEVISKALIEKNSNDNETNTSNEVDIKNAVEQELNDDGMDDLMDQLLSHEEESK